LTYIYIYISHIPFPLSSHMSSQREGVSVSLKAVRSSFWFGLRKQQRIAKDAMENVVTATAVEGATAGESEDNGGDHSSRGGGDSGGGGDGDGDDEWTGSSAPAAASGGRTVDSAASEAAALAAEAAAEAAFLEAVEGDSAMPTAMVDDADVYAPAEEEREGGEAEGGGPHREADRRAVKRTEEKEENLGCCISRARRRGNGLGLQPTTQHHWAATWMTGDLRPGTCAPLAAQVALVNCDLLSMHATIYLSIHLSIHPSLYLFVCLFMYWYRSIAVLSPNTQFKTNSLLWPLILDS
jgi:hypothetical protein